MTGSTPGTWPPGQQCGQVREFFNRFRTEKNLILVDPAMADNGKLYPAFDESFPASMAKVCAVRM